MTWPLNKPVGRGKRLREIRLEYAYRGVSGGGCWALDNPRWRMTLESHVRQLNAEYGADTHWIAERDA